METTTGEQGMEAELAAARLPLPNQQYGPLSLLQSDSAINKQTTAIDLRIHNHQMKC